MNKKICVLGLGHVGLPLACILANNGYHVIGVDINPDVIQQIESRNLQNIEPGLNKILKRVYQNGGLKVSTQVHPADIYIIAVPTLLTNNNQADLTCLWDAFNSIKPLLRKNNLIIIESTCPIHTTSSVARKLELEKMGVSIAYCPERVIPGNVVQELIYNDRVIGGINESSTRKAENFYQTFIKGDILKTNSSTAESVKLVENSYRDLNIAFANELSMLGEHLGFDANEVIKLANRHPRVNILNPGVGVGGHCIAIDPWYLISSAPNQTQLMATARKTNLDKTKWVIECIKSKIKENGCKKIACLGLTYKADVSDNRSSPAQHIVDELKKHYAILEVDPNITNTAPLKNALSQADMIVGLVPHKQFFKIPKTQLKNKIVLDFCNIFGKNGGMK